MCKKHNLKIKSLSKKQGNGFTILELLMLLLVVGILATLAYGEYGRYFDKARVAVAKADLFDISLRLSVYFINNKSYPETLADIGGASLDPWGNPYQYLNIQTARGKGKLRKDRNLVPINSDFDLYSKGKDGRSVSPLTAKSSKDDVIRANNGGYYGLAKDY